MEIGNTRVGKSFLLTEEVAESLWCGINQDDKLFRGFLSDGEIKSDEITSLKSVIEETFKLFDIVGVWSNREKALNHPVDDVFVGYQYETGKDLKVVTLVEVNPVFCRENEKVVENQEVTSGDFINILKKLKKDLTES